MGQKIHPGGLRLLRLSGVLGRLHVLEGLALLRILWILRAHRTLPLDSWPR